MTPKTPGAKRPPVPRQARAYPTLQAWLSNESNQERLKQLLTDDVFLAACHYLADEYRVTPDAIRHEGAELIARRTAMHTVVSQFPDLLKNLIKRPAARTEFEPWAHINPNNQ